MSAPTLTRQQLLALNPCAAASRRIIAALGGEDGWVSPVTAAQAREAGATLSDLAWAASAVSRTDPDVARRLRLWAADCAAHVLHIYERAGESDAPRNAIVAARRFARGEVGTGYLAAASDAAEDAAKAAAEDAANAAAWDAAWAAAWAAAGDAGKAAAKAAARAAANAGRNAAMAAAWAAAWDAAWAAVWVVVRDAARAAAGDAAWDAASGAAWDAARAAEEAWQFDRLILWLSGDEPEDWPLPPRKEGGA